MINFRHKKYRTLCQQPLEEINVCICINNKYIPFAGVTITSILYHTKCFIKFYIIHTDCTKEQINRFKKYFKDFQNASFDFIKIGIDKELTEFPQKQNYISKDACARLIFPNLKSNVKRVIYTDVDVIFVEDIKKLYHEKLNNHIIGAVKGIYHDNKLDNKRLKISDAHSYFQSGLLLIDCHQYREKNILQKLQKINLEKMDVLKYVDQDLLNIVFENNYQRLNYKWCVMPNQIELFEKFSPESKQALLNPGIIHYVGMYKPWLYSCPMDEYFWKYAKLSPFYKEIKQIKINQQIKKYNINLLGISIITIIDKINGQRNIRLFGLIPLIKIKYKLQKTKIYLFDIFPVWKINKGN